MWLYIYPFFATLWCIRKPLKNELLHWLIWWFVYQSFATINRVVWWVPLIVYIENGILFFLYFPPLTDYLRKNVLLISTKKIQKILESYQINIYILQCKKYILENISQIKM